ncbi:MAG: tRNA(ile2) 2-agmatinylcytidine synthetase [Candidatus Bathyarchaeota archaeon B63]|nr:MAG: tRNA(ile2) 2-agmatinylcytidine synthetase [Candidatus Bathyarchaeota archaeon B63]
MKLHIGFDDTDSPRGGCTTYVAALIIERLHELGVSFLDYPSLIRLNPNVPWKTRGNGAICLRVMCDNSLRDELMERVIRTVEEQADLSFEGTDPGIVFLPGDVPLEVEAFARRAITGLVEKAEALSLIRRYGAEAVGFKEGRGIIGGLAAIGEQLRDDHTYELIAYRTPENRGTERRVKESSVMEMDKRLGRLVFNNVDYETGRILITPRGPDPVLYGIRGETAEAVKRGHEMVIAEEPIERWVIFRTNQGTDAHLRRASSIGEVEPYSPVILVGEVSGDPRVIRGGHVIFSIRDSTGQIDCAAYEPTGRLREVARRLTAGDLVEVHGGVRPPSPSIPMTVNVEKIRILRLAKIRIYRNPLCPECGKRMKSMGRQKGFECKRCGFHGRDLEKTVMEWPRDLKVGLYVTPPRSQRHLTKPLSRYGLEKRGEEGSFLGSVPYGEISGR